MQNSAWIALLRLIPPEQQDNIILTTSNGTDIAVQTVIRAENDYLVLRGRLTGTTEGGGFFFLPYDQIVYLGFLRPWKEIEIRAMFGEKILPPVSAEEERSTAQPEIAPPPEGVENAPQTPAAPPPAEDSPKRSGGGSGTFIRPGRRTPAVGPSSTNKAALLEKLRSRRSESGNPPSSP
jgi:hypothetical protein